MDYDRFYRRWMASSDRDDNESSATDLWMSQLVLFWWENVVIKFK